MTKKYPYIQSVFCKFLGREARKLARDGVVRIIEYKDFPEGVPIHEDGSTEYDPMKPLVLFAVSIQTPEAAEAWEKVLTEREVIIANA